ncbi:MULTISPECIES: YhgE/Pip domain-containing protein [unclassified Clostridium]|uniref:YhgE/Pip family protein n=1 Tax=unclassified Clostridium TaxID=2614128 RepID=UPI0002981EEA|nr:MULTISPECIES: YhgE/Pip domain-containing protein [unclassified Clostridium]EKQ50930.1 MAG: YhgE/Pip-like protein [Clostridium sp. Maddingley MBC34-26]
MKRKDKKHNKKFLVTILAVSIAAVIFIPMLYSSIYLGAFWDPYNNLSNVPVAFVNLDKPVTKAGKEYAVGKELENKLKDNDKVAWKFVSLEEAQKGVSGTDYYAMIEIPEDFSEKIADSKDGEMKNPEVIYEANKGKNFIFSQISEKVAESLKTEVSSNIQKEISKALVDSLYDVKVSIKDAGNGADQLQAGTQKLLAGSSKLTNGLGQAADGSVQLTNGLMQANNGTASLENGTQKLLDGSINLSNGMSTAANGTKQLQLGLNSLSEGENQIANGSVTLVNGLTSFKSSLNQPNDKISALVKGASDISSSAELIEQGAEKLDNSLSGLNSLGDGVKQASDGISQASSVFNEELSNIDNSNLSQADKDKLKAAISVVNKVNNANMSSSIEVPLRAAADSAKPLVSSLKQLKDGTKQVSDGVGQLSSSIADNQTKAASSLDQLINGALSIQNGSKNIMTGLNTVTQKSGELWNGLSSLSNGSISLEDGLKSVNEGTVSLANGINTAATKTGELSNGLKQLSDGSSSLNSGLMDANNGVNKLSNGLNSGYDKMNENLKFNSENMSEFVSNPVTLKDNSINDVKHYGEGLAPYFISLSLWLGAMFVNLILSIAKSLKLVENRVLKSFTGKLLVGSGLSVIQAMILSFVLVKGLNIDVTSVSNFYISNMFIAVVFFCVMYGLSHAIGIISAPIMFIVFLLQLSSAGGTFPIETAPEFYRVVGEVFPMTYAISTLRMIISGTNSSVLNNNVKIMLTFIGVFLGGGVLIKSIFSQMKKKKQDINFLKTV